MVPKPRRFFPIVLGCLLASLVPPAESFSATLPKSTQEILKKLNLDSAILSDLDKELQVPREWVDGAKREGRVRVLAGGDPSSAKNAIAPFRERYPFIDVEFSHADQAVRTIKTLVAFRARRIVTDVLDSIGGSFYAYKEANALEDLRNIPGIQNIPEGARDPEGLWAGVHMKYWCMAYNTKLVKQEDLPRRWEDFLTNPFWRGGKLALGNRANLWALNVWQVRGEKWTKEYLTKLFKEVKPQLRKEGLNALPELVAAGELHAALPSPDSTTYRLVSRGAPISYACPEPVPAAAEEVTIIKGAPNMNGARLFVNWWWSKEGQVAGFAYGSSSPVHKGLVRREFIPFADQVIGKQISYREPGAELDVWPKLLEFWNQLWMQGSGGK